MKRTVRIEVTLWQRPEDKAEWSNENIGTTKISASTAAPLDAILGHVGKSILGLIAAADALSGAEVVVDPDEAPSELGAGASVEAYRG